MFADMELIGIPHRVVMGDRSLDNNMVEYKARSDKDSEEIAVDTIADYIIDKVRNEK